MRTMPRPVRFAAALFATGLFCLGCSTSHRSSTPAANSTGGSSATPLVWAERLVTGVGQDANAYASSPATVSWAGVNGARETRNRSVCSTLVTALVQQAYGYAADDITGWLGSSSPTAAEFYTAISSSRGFSQVSRIGDIAPGDILAVEYPAGSHPTGHVMIVEQAPVPRVPTAPVVSGSEQYEVVVIDSATTGHGPGDTRSIAGGKFHSGVGRGTLRLYVDGTGAISGYSWSTLSVSRFVGRGQHPILVGRIDLSWRPGQGRQGRTSAAHGDDDLESGPETTGP